MGRFRRGGCVRYRRSCGAFARSFELVLGMVRIDHSSDGNDRMRLSHDALVSTLAMSAFGESGHPPLHCTCPLSGVKRTSSLAPHMSAFDPKRTSIQPEPTPSRALT